MKVVDYETFIRMPAGTIFSPLRNGCFADEFEIKVDGGEEYEYNGEQKYGYTGTMPITPWVGEYQSIDFYGEHDAELVIYDGSNADVMDYDKFAVLDPHDVKELINALYWALDGCPGGGHHDYKEKEKPC